MPLTQAQVNVYIDKQGAVCPVCGDSDIEGGVVEISGGSARQDCNCLACGATWTDCYHLAAVIDDEGTVIDAEDSTAACMAELHGYGERAQRARGHSDVLAIMGRHGVRP